MTTPDTYCIVRFFAPHLDRERETIKTGLTLEEAQEHCRREDTRSPGSWFDGYDYDNGDEGTED